MTIQLLVCYRTEQLLSGIVKLVEDDVLTQMPISSQGNIKRSSGQADATTTNFSKKKPLQPSKSTPIITKSKSEYTLNVKTVNSHSKPASPTSITKRFPCELDINM